MGTDIETEGLRFDANDLRQRGLALRSLQRQMWAIGDDRPGVSQSGYNDKDGVFAGDDPVLEAFIAETRVAV